MKALIAFAAATLLFACEEPGSENVAVRWLDYEVFVEDVQPVLAEMCGNPSCHGRPDRAFSIYSQRNWREDPDLLFRPDELSSAELNHNYEGSCVLVSEAAGAEDTLLLKKSLGKAAGVYHGGGAVLEESDRSYRILLDWVKKGWAE